MPSTRKPAIKSHRSRIRAAREAPSANTLWSDEELRRSVDVYVLLLRFQMQGMDQKSEPIAQALLSGPLALRNSAAIRYRLRNISAVVRELGAPTLVDFSPAESVGNGVRLRIREMLLENRDFALLLSVTARSREEERQDARTALEALRERIAEIEHEFTWMGHNNPPDVLSSDGLDQGQFRQAIADIDALQGELDAEEPNPARVQQSKSRLIQFAVLVAKWAGKRMTKFVDASLVAAGPALVVKVFGLMPTIVDALEAVGRAVSH